MKAIIALSILLVGCAPGFQVQDGFVTQSSVREIGVGITPSGTPTPQARVFGVDYSNPRLIEERVSPLQLDTEVTAWNDTQVALVDTRVTQKGYVVLWLHGAGATTTPVGQRAGLVRIAGLGLHTIAIDYAQDYGIEADCAASDRTCYGMKRVEAFAGVNASPYVDVSKANSIEERFKRMLLHMQEVQPNYGWDYFLTSEDEIDWSKVIVAGHSHGAATATLIGKIREVARVVAFSGPYDLYSNGEPDRWLTTAGLTAAEKYYSLLSTGDDRYAGMRQGWSYFGMDLAGGGIADVTNGLAPSQDEHALYITTNYGSVANNHSSTSPVYSASSAQLTPVWRYMFTDGLALPQ